MPYKDETDPDKNLWVIVGIDGSAALVEMKQIVMTDAPITFLEQTLSPEGEGVRVGSKAEFVSDMFLRVTNYVQESLNNKSHPQEMTKIIEKASRQALERKKQMYKNIASTRAPIINSLQNILKPPEPTA